ncbi:hypothetical protein ACFWB2_40275 [Streptomyces virginiae]|uniref:hypothetical protein n=1 Tax=Streptomyces virginiae TaxID=1961 RepID=UPI002DDB10C7|nr:hypothetical protein [Streptomyces virginiae]WSC75477.1 hypothetical protein OHA56_03630 [Streptomyces virginiae]
MSETTSNSKGPAQVQFTFKTTEPALVPADQVKPEDVGTLAIRYVDGTPQLVVSGGPAIPARLAVVNESGNEVTAYTAGPVPGDPATRQGALYIPRLPALQG